MLYHVTEVKIEDAAKIESFSKKAFNAMELSRYGFNYCSSTWLKRLKKFIGGANGYCINIKDNDSILGVACAYSSPSLYDCSQISLTCSGVQPNHELSHTVKTKVVLSLISRLEEISKEEGMLFNIFSIDPSVDLGKHLEKYGYKLCTNYYIKEVS